jgi:hypothetical protein
MRRDVRRSTFSTVGEVGRNEDFSFSSRHHSFDSSVEATNDLSFASEERKTLSA